MAGYSAAVHHGISVLINDMQHRMQKGSDPAPTIKLIDALAEAFPGDAQQKRFYGAIRNLTYKIAGGEWTE